MSPGRGCSRLHLYTEQPAILKNRDKAGAELVTPESRAVFFGEGGQHSLFNVISGLK